jgi:hypothetical protein
MPAASFRWLQKSSKGFLTLTASTQNAFVDQLLEMLMSYREKA